MDNVSSSTRLCTVTEPPSQPIDGGLSTDIETVEIEDSADPTDDSLQLIVDKDCFTLNPNYEEVIDVDKESDDVVIIENNEPAIIIDDDNECEEVSNVEVLSKSIKEKEMTLLQDVCIENRLLGQIIEECINLDNSGSMKRIINKTLIPLYINCSITYKYSDELNNSLKRTFNLLGTAPHLKFSHLKSLCELLKYDHFGGKFPVLNQRVPYKSKRRKKRINPITLAKRRRVHIVDLCQDFRLENEDDDVLLINDNVDRNTINLVNTNTSTELNITDKSTTNNIQIPSQNKENIIKNTQTISKRNIEVPNQDLLEPSHAIKATIVPVELVNDKVQNIELEIKKLKKELAELEEMEVTRDDYSSPYIRCEQIKEKIVHKYKKICKIMGTEHTKRHEVKLQVAAGHPEGPAKCLQEYLNANIDGYGNPPFPDIFDVVDCVDKANRIYNLKWNRKQIVKEAENLLKIYGTALQKRRMKREWRDMKSLCKEKMLDPAEQDPLLEARLLENRRIGIKNEEEVLNRYAQLERETVKGSGFNLTVENDDTDDSEHEMDPGPSLSSNAVNNSIDTVNTSNNAINNSVDIVNNTNNNVVNNTNNNVVNNSVGIVNNTRSNPFHNSVQIVNNTGNNYVSNSVDIVNNTSSKVVDNSVDIVNNILLDIINDTGVDVANNASISIVNNTSLNVPNRSKITINNTVNNGLNICNNNSVSINNTINNGFGINTSDDAKNTSQSIDNTVSSTTFSTEENETFKNTELLKTPLSTNELLTTLTNVVPVIIFEDQESQNKVKENIQICTDTAKIDNIEYNRTIMIDSELNNEGLSEDSKSFVTNNLVEGDKMSELTVKVKQEREDVIKLLEELGNNFTATIFDIEDPFLVIEISDSSDSENEDVTDKL